MQVDTYYFLKYHVINTTDACWANGFFAHPQTDELALHNSTVLSEAYRVNKILEGGALPCDDPNQYIFWDKVHPTEIVHKLLAQIVENALLSQPIATK